MTMTAKQYTADLSGADLRAEQMIGPLITFAEAAKLIGPDITAGNLRTWHPAIQPA